MSPHRGSPSGNGSSKKQGKPKKRGPVGKVITLLVLVAVVYVLGSAGLCWLLIRPNDRGLMLEPRTRGVSVGEVEFESSDGVKLRGWFSEAKDKPVVLLAHGRRGHRGQFRELYTALFLQHGLGFFCFDFRGSGKSDGFFSTGGVKEARDLEAALDWLEKKGYASRQIGLVALDMGAVAAMQIPSRIDDLGACVFVAPSEDAERQLQRRLDKLHLPLRPTASLALIGARLVTKTRLRIPELEGNFGKLYSAPLLFLVGELDEITTSERVRGWFQSVPNEQKQLVELKGADHDAMLRNDNSEIVGQVAKFLKAHLDD
jgi:alpha-beta hydrolase superfamily lysophospholipase